VATDQLPLVVIADNQVCGILHWYLDSLFVRGPAKYSQWIIDTLKDGVEEFIYINSNAAVAMASLCCVFCRY
jgi:hypothetical protein